MNPREKAILQKNFSFLKDNLEVDILRPHLFEKSILNYDDMEVLSKPCHTQSRRMEILLLHILPRRGPMAYQEFINALRSTEMYLHVIEALENTTVSEADLRSVESDERKEFHRKICEIYDEIKLLKSDLELNNESGELTENLDNQPPFENCSMTVPPKFGNDTFEVQLRNTETSRQCGFESGLYLLCLSSNGIALISQKDGLPESDITKCERKAHWTYDVIRRYGTSTNGIVIVAGRNACTGEGEFYFVTTQAEQIFSIVRSYCRDLLDPEQLHN